MSLCGRQPGAQAHLLPNLVLDGVPSAMARGDADRVALGGAVRVADGSTLVVAGGLADGLALPVGVAQLVALIVADLVALVVALLVAHVAALVVALVGTPVGTVQDRRADVGRDGLRRDDNDAGAGVHEDAAAQGRPGVAVPPDAADLAGPDCRVDGLPAQLCPGLRRRGHGGGPGDCLALELLHIDDDRAIRVIRGRDIERYGVVPNALRVLDVNRRGENPRKVRGGGS